MDFKLIQLICVFITVSGVNSVTLYSTFSHLGVRGTVHFFQTSSEQPVEISVSLQTTNENAAGDYSWFIYEYPVDYTSQDRCTRGNLGAQLRKLDGFLGQLTLPQNGTLTFHSDQLTLMGANSLFGHTLLLEGKISVCASITTDKKIRTSEARFYSPIAGSVLFRTLEEDDGEVVTTIFSNLYHVTDNTSGTQHKWQILITDILNSQNDEHHSSCNFLHILYDPDNREDAECSPENPQKCKEGDMTPKLGKLRIGSRQGPFSKRVYTDPSLALRHLEVKGRSLYLVLFDPEHDSAFFACAKIGELKPKRAIATLLADGVKGNVTFMQKTPFDVTTVQVNFENLRSIAGPYHVHEFPVPPTITSSETSICLSVAGHYNPYGWDVIQSPKPGSGTDEQYELGDLSGKYGTLVGLDSFNSAYNDTNLPLFGQQSIIGRSIVVHRARDGSRWLCGNIVSLEPTITAVVTFRYPIVGRIFFRQESENPFSETSIYIESLVYSDGSRNDTEDHRWHINVNVPGKDYYNWTGRCVSAGGHYNPYKVSVTEKGYSECSAKNQFRCEAGDLVSRHGQLFIAGSKESMSKTKRYFTDVNLPLYGQQSIIGKSIVIHDDKLSEHALKTRGDRLACTRIDRYFRRKAVVKDWFGNGIETSISGSLEFLQNSQFDLSSTQIEIEGLQAIASGYHVHLSPVPLDVTFPCAGSEVAGHYNPFGVDVVQSPAAGQGTPDQYEVGDLSGKYGTLDNLDNLEHGYNDTNLMLFGPTSIIGRSIVIHKKEKAERWACATIGRGYSPSEAHEYRAIASFHHPGGFLYGYIRMTQLIYLDGSAASDTTLEVNLRHYGKNNRNVTTGHNWSVYVNPVGQDASVQQFIIRCVAAGYRWNPFFIHLAKPNDHEYYSQECNPENPLRCDVGDISGRVGPIDIGSKKYLLHDVNLPLGGEGAIIGRSIVIHNKDGGSERFACAVIQPDKDIIKYVNIRKPPKFIENIILRDIRDVMGIPEWMLTVDSRKTKILQDGKCVQFLLHFMGPIADKLEQDFGKLINSGELRVPSLDIPGIYPSANRKSTLPYRTCSSEGKGNRNENQYNAGSMISVNYNIRLILCAVILWMYTLN